MVVVPIKAVGVIIPGITPVVVVLVTIATSTVVMVVIIMVLVTLQGVCPVSNIILEVGFHGWTHATSISAVIGSVGVLGGMPVTAVVLRVMPIGVGAIIIFPSVVITGVVSGGGIEPN